MSQEKVAPKKRTLPTTPDLWLDEILRAWNEAVHSKPFGLPVGTVLTDKELLPLAALVCLKYRGREQTGPEADRVRETALANYVASTRPGEPAHQAVGNNPKMAFALVYLEAHLVLGLVDRQMVRRVMQYCDERLVG